MSSIIDAKPFGDVFTATRHNSLLQAVVTAIYELGMSGFSRTTNTSNKLQVVLRVQSSSSFSATGSVDASKLCSELP